MVLPVAGRIYFEFHNLWEKVLGAIPQQRSMENLYMDQRYDEASRDYLERFMNLTSQIFDLDSRQAVNLFVRGLVKGSLMHERFL